MVKARLFAFISYPSTNLYYAHCYQAFTGHFVQSKTKKRKAEKSSKSQKRARTNHGSAPGPATPGDSEDTITQNSEELEDKSVDEPEASADAPDEGRRLHDEYVINEMTVAGLRYATEDLGLVISEAMKICTCGVISKVSTGYIASFVKTTY